MAEVHRLQSESPTFSTQTYRIEVHQRAPTEKTDSQHTWNTVNLFFVRGRLVFEDAQRLAAELLTDPITETFAIRALDIPNEHTSLEPLEHTVEVTLLPGVTDPAAENLVRAAHLLGLTALEQAATGQRYIVRGKEGNPRLHDLHRLALDVFSNPVIQRVSIDEPISPPFVPYQRADDTVETVPLSEADDAALLAISAERRLSCDLAEMQAIRAYFSQAGREPTDVELEMLAQTWSEHCGHKTFKALIDYTDAQGSQTIDGLLRTYIRAATERVDKPWVRSAFVDNAGMVTFDERWDLAFKVETHNHPSALEPFGGANTGVGGVVRDILGVSARPIANTDVLCFGPPDLPEAEVPGGVLHPRRIAEGVVHGVEDYGNKMGIPTVNGAILYHPGYTSNPLVFCGCLGLLPHGSHVTDPRPGDLIIVIGGRTGRDGLRGATFSSMEMDHTTSEAAGSAVQIGHPIHEKQVQEVVLRARDAKLYHAITDCGAGGLSSAVGEMARTLGATVQLESVPLKYPGLRPWEIWLSEAQERMVFAIPPENWPAFQAICDGQDVEAVRIGTLEATGHLRLYYGGRLVCDLSMDFLHDGIPQRHLKAVWEPPEAASPDSQPEQHQPPELSCALLALLSHPNIRSKEAVIRRYDHEVQTGTAIKPLVGADNHGPGDAAVLVPLDSLNVNDTGIVMPGVAVAAGVCPAYVDLDPYAMAWAAIDEAIRNSVAVGADPDRVALLDNFCWGNPLLPDRLGSLARCAQGCYDAAVAYNAPFVSGKDSLNNEYTDPNGEKQSIPGTLLISAMGIVPDIKHTVTMDLKAPGNRLYVVGETRAELGGSHYRLITGEPGGTVPQPVPNALDTLRALHRAITAGLVESCHDCSEGGIGVALAEMCIAGRHGAVVSLDRVPGVEQITRPDTLLFSESLCRFIVEVKSANEDAFNAKLAGVPHAAIGVVDEFDLLILKYPGIDDVWIAVRDLEREWRGEPITSPASDIPTVPPVRAKRASPVIPSIISPVRVLILHASGTNRDRDAALACEMAGALPEIVHVNQILSGERNLLDYHMLVIPGGFSYGDDLGAGKLWAVYLQHGLGEAANRFVASGRPVLGICNGFQVLVKSGLLPGPDWPGTNEINGTVGQVHITLTHNLSGHFECRWVYLRPNPASPCIFTEGQGDLIYCPVAHGEGRLVVADTANRWALWNEGLVSLTYVNADGSPAGYPANPNGSDWAIAGLCNPAGNVLGLMPHPENHIFAWQHPRWQHGEHSQTGLRLFENGIRYARR